jgi:hypothetical protein
VHETHVLRFENEAQDVVVQLRRTFEGNGVGESYLFGLEAFDLKLGDTTQCTSSPEALAYDNTHHNWADAASASVGSIRYELSIVFSTDSLEWSATLTGYDERDAVVFEPLVLIPTGGPTNCFSCPNRTEALITEIMPNNGSVLSDEASEYPPWIELCHMSASGSVNFDGWWLSDALHDRRRWPLPPVELTGLECLVVLADSDVDQGELHANFELSPEGGELVLTDPRGVTDGGFVYQAQAEDVSLLWSWTDSSYVASEEPTPGLLNQTE